MLSTKQLLDAKKKQIIGQIRRRKKKSNTLTPAVASTGRPMSSRPTAQHCSNSLPQTTCGGHARPSVFGCPLSPASQPPVPSARSQDQQQPRATPCDSESQTHSIQLPSAHHPAPASYDNACLLCTLPANVGWPAGLPRPRIPPTTRTLSCQFTARFPQAVTR